MINPLIETLHLPDAPAIPGLTVRRFQGESDFPKMADLIIACNLADQIEELTTAEELAHNYAHLSNCDLSQDMLLVEIDDELAGFAFVLWRDEDEGTRQYFQRGCVRPAWRRQGLGRALLKWSEGRAREIAAGHPIDRPRYLRVWCWCFGAVVGKAAMLEREGYRVARRHYLMRRPTLDELPDAPVPPGLELRPVQPEHLRAIWDGMVEAFRDHWGAGPVTEEDYTGWRDSPQHDLGLWQVAWDGDQVAGLSINMSSQAENEHFQRKEFWVEDLAVRRPWRKRGLGRALLVNSMRLLRDEYGMTSAALGVDTENLSGALRLYESVGFQPVQSAAVYRKPLT
ncbi:MAG TPA: GNAT family N-acetyltransferase [Anaerolineae bacterium]|nr:GNAT family N-acetyltransferase [Anaerolineae bacterium]